MNLHSITRRQWLARSSLAGFAGIALPHVAPAAPPRVAPKTDWYRQIVMAAGPVGYWRLGEPAGSTIATDQTSKHHDGAYHGQPRLGQPRLGQPGALAGDRDTAVALDGQSYVEIPDSPAFSQPASGQGLSVEAWLRPDVLEFTGGKAGPYIHWLGKGEAGRSEWGFRFYSKTSPDRPNRISAYIWNPNGKLGAGAYFQDALVPGEWLHIVACFDPGDASTAGTPGVTIYRDGVRRNGPPDKGVLYNNPSWTIMPAHGTSPLRLGTVERQTFLVGALDEVAIYPRVLSADEIRLHHALGRTPRLTPAEQKQLKQWLRPQR